MITMTATPAPATGSVQLKLTGTATVTRLERADANGTTSVRTLPGVLPWTPGVNLAATGSAEVTTNYAAAYNTGGAGTLAVQATGGALDGGKYVRATWTTASTAGGSTTVSYTHAKTGAAGDKASGGVWVRFNKATTVTPMMRFRNGSTTVGQVNAPNVAAPANEWVYITVDEVTATGAYTNIQVYPFIPGAPAMAVGDTFDVDGVTIYAGPMPALYVDDYEPAAGPVNYWAETSAGTVPVSLSFDLGSPWLFVPLQPAYSAELVSVTAYNATRPGRSTVLEPIGRRDPVVITRAMGSRRGSLSAFAGPHAAALELLAACDRGEVLMLRQPEHAGLDMYFICEAANVETLEVEGAKTLWGVSLDYIEVSRPTDDITGALGWTFAELAASAPSFATVTRRYTSFENLRLDTRA